MGLSVAKSGLISCHQRGPTNCPRVKLLSSSSKLQTHTQKKTTVSSAQVVLLHTHSAYQIRGKEEEEKVQMTKKRNLGPEIDLDLGLSIERALWHLEETMAPLWEAVRTKIAMIFGVCNCMVLCPTHK